MDKIRARPNVPDIVIGLALILFIPLLTYLVYFQSEDPKKNTGNSSVVPLTYTELDERIDEYKRMYEQRANLFIIRATNSRYSKYRSQELAWARQVLTLCRKNFANLLARAKARPVSSNVSDRLPEIERWVERIDNRLAGL